MSYETCGTACETKAPQQETLRQIISEIAKLLSEANYEARELGEALEGGNDKLNPGCEPTPISLRQHLDSIRYQARLVAQLNAANHSVVGRIQPPPIQPPLMSDRITQMANTCREGKSPR